MMKIIRNLKIAKKMMLLPGVVFISIVALSLGTYGGFSTQKTAINEIFNDRFKAYQETADIIKKVANVHANIYKVISWGNANFEAKKIEALANEQKDSLAKTIELVRSTLKSGNLSPDEKILFQKTLADLLEYQQPSEGVISLGASDSNAATMFMGTADDKYQVLNQTLEELLVLEKKLSRRKYDDSLSSFSSVTKIYIIVLLIAIILSVVTSIAVTRLITQPIREVNAVIKKLAEGDLTQEVNVDSRDEIGDLASSVNTMRLNMGEAVGQSLSISHVLSESSFKQASALEESSASLDEISAMTRQNAGNTTEANNLMSAARQSIGKANSSMSDLTNSMKEIATASEQTQKIIKSIDEIAFQTNLLALNAAVEAARAGETGAGFAVVADEVRNLAMRATASAKDTASLIDNIVKKVRGGESLVNVTNDVFKEVTASSTKVVELMGEIAVASREQSQGIDQVNRAVAEMNQVTQQNAASAEELTASMAMFKVGNNIRQNSGAALSWKKTVKTKSILQTDQRDSERLIPLMGEDFA